MSSRGAAILPAGVQRSDVEGGDVPLESPWESVPIRSSSPQAVFAVHTQDTPGERPSRNRRLLFVGGVAAAVLVVLAAIIVLGANHSSGSSYEVRFLAIGDWGRQGGDNQTDVAELMERVAEGWPVDFIVSTGDNFYDSGLKSVDDPAFEQSFTNVYTHQSLQVPWHAVLGNHDVCDGSEGCDSKQGCPFSPLYQLNISLTNRDPRWHCERSYTHRVADGRVEFFFIDTTPFIQRYYNQSDPKNSFIHCLGGLLQQSWQAQLLELEHRLNASTAEWKLVVGHHPLYSNGEHGNNTDLVQHLEPLMWRYGVQAYFAGHDHNLEHLTIMREPPSSGQQQVQQQQRQIYDIIVSGAGSKTQRGQFGTAQSRWFYPWSGFVGVSITPSRLAVNYYTLESEKAVYTGTIERQAAR